MRISDWSSDVCSSDLAGDGNFELVAPAIGAVVGDQHIIFGHRFRTWKTSLEKFALLDEGFALPYPLHQVQRFELARRQARDILIAMEDRVGVMAPGCDAEEVAAFHHLAEPADADRSEGHTSELQSLMRTSNAVS